MTDTVGEIRELREELHFEWDIFNVFELNQRADSYYNSPVFNFDGTKWFLQIYLNGQRSDNSVGWISLYLNKLFDESEKKGITFTIGIKDRKVIKLEDRCFVKHDGWGTNSLMRRVELLRNRDEIAPDGVLRIICSMDHPTRCFAEIACQTETLGDANCKSKNPLQSPGINLKDLLIGQKNCDIAINVNEQEFQAHKIILGARSPVFAAMFEHDVAEICSVRITDADPDVFYDILLYIYSGAVRNLNTNNASKYYKLADKYDLKELKDECMKKLMQSNSWSSFFEFFHLLGMDNLRKMMDFAKALMTGNIIQLIESEDWRIFSSENPSLSVKILELAIKMSHKKQNKKENKDLTPLEG